MTSSTRNVTYFRGHQGSLQSIGRCRFRWLGRSVMNGTAAGNRTDRLTGKGGNLRKDRQVNTIRSSAAASKGGASVDTRHHHDDTDPKNQGNVVEEIHICRHCLSNKIVNLKSNCDSFWSMLGITINGVVSACFVCQLNCFCVGCFRSWFLQKVLSALEKASRHKQTVQGTTPCSRRSSLSGLCRKQVCFGHCCRKKCRRLEERTNQDSPFAC